MPLLNVSWRHCAFEALCPSLLELDQALIPLTLKIFSCIFRFPLFALAWMGLCQLFPGLFALCRCAQAVQSSLEPEQALDHSPDTSSSCSDSGLLMNLSPLILLLFIGFFLGIAGFSAGHSPRQWIQHSLPPTHMVGSALARTASHTNSCFQNIARAIVMCLMATQTTRGTCQESWWQQCPLSPLRLASAAVLLETAGWHQIPSVLSREKMS